MNNDDRTVHGGWIETAVKVGFGLLLACLVTLKLIDVEADRRPEPPLSSEVRAEVIAEAELVHGEFAARGGGWTTQEAVASRNRLVELRERLHPDDTSGRARIEPLLEHVVGLATGERRAAVEAARREGGIAFQRVLWEDQELNLAYMHSAPMLPSRGRVTAMSFVWLAAYACLAYLLFVPFVLVIFAARLRKQGVSFTDELVYGWRNMLLSAVVWPFGLGDYPCDTAQAIRRRRIEAEYRARVGKTRWNDELTSADQRRIEELVAAPKVELAARLAAIRDMPAAMLWQARLAAYTGMIIGFLTVSLSASVRAQETPPSAEAAETTEEDERPPFELHGFTQVEAGVPDRPLTVARTWLTGEAHPLPEMDVRIVLDLFGPGGTLILRDAYMRIAPEGSPFSLRAGQMVNRAVFMLPELTQERLIGGPGAGALMSFLDLGVEAAFQDRWFVCALEVMSGAGMNRPDDNDDKDVMVSMALGPFGPLRFALAYQVGNQPDGFRMRSAVHAVGAFGPVTVDLLGTHQLAAGAHSWAASGMIGWRIHPYLDLAAGYDEMHLAGSPDDHVLRAQLTLHLLDDHVELAAAYRWSDVEGHALLSRLQASF